MRLTSCFLSLRVSLKNCLVPRCAGAIYSQLRRASYQLRRDDHLLGMYFITEAPGRLQAVRRAIRHSQASLNALAGQYGINPKTVAKWRRRQFAHDAPMGPKESRSTVLTLEEEAVIVAFRKFTLLPLDDCLYALQPSLPHLTRSSLHRCLQRHGISRLPEVEGDKPAKKKFKHYPIGYFHID